MLMTCSRQDLAFASKYGKHFAREIVVGLSFHPWRSRYNFLSSFKAQSAIPLVPCVLRSPSAASNLPVSSAASTRSKSADATPCVSSTASGSTDATPWVYSTTSGSADATPREYSTTSGSADATPRVHSTTIDSANATPRTYSTRSTTSNAATVAPTEIPTNPAACIEGRFRMNVCPMHVNISCPNSRRAAFMSWGLVQSADTMDVLTDKHSLACQVPSLK